MDVTMAENGGSGSSVNEVKPSCLKVFVGKMGKLPRKVWQTVWKIGQDDPRRVTHSLKVGVALTIVSMLYLTEPLFLGIGGNAIWAVMTVVVVLEFTAGATLCKGLNRGIGTLCAGSLTYIIEYVADESGRIVRAVFIGTSVFMIGAACTYMRFYPYIKQNYDYGVLIFLLTFNLIIVSSYRVDDVLQIAHQRLYTIAIGCAICLLMSLLIFPNWSGQDLHNSTVKKIEGLAKSVEACVNEYFRDEDIKENEDNSSDDAIYKSYKTVLDSKSKDETLALYASWEPTCSIRCYRYPWNQYVKLGDALRHFGYTTVALHGCLHSEIQTPRSVRALFQDPFVRLSGEISKVLMELADSIRKRHQHSSEPLSDNLKEALEDLNTAIKSQPRLFLGSNHKQPTDILAVAAATATEETNSIFPLSSLNADSIFAWKGTKVADESTEIGRRILRPSLSKIAIASLEFSEALSFAAFASLLVETVARLDPIIQEVEELGRLARFKQLKPRNEVTVTCERQQTENIHNFQIHLPSSNAE